MSYPILTYSRNPADFSYNLSALQQAGLKAIRLIYKGMSEDAFLHRLNEIQDKIVQQHLSLDILIDLPGSKPIVGQLGAGIHIEAGQNCVLIPHTAVPTPNAIPTLGLFTHTSFPTLAVNDIVSIADGELNLLITDINASGLHCRALTSFFLTAGRSLSMRNKSFPFSANSDKDLSLVRHPQPPNVHYLVSFTQSAHDLLQLKSIQPNINVIPKIENILDDAAIANILQHCNTVMLGRGDLSTGAPAHQLFGFQKRLIDMCHMHQKQLIIATGILGGIGEKGTPTIADVMDYGYLRDSGINAFLIAGTNALHKPFETLQYMQSFG